MKNIAILGSTGSIGTQALDVIRDNKTDFKVCALTANSNIDILYDQVLEFSPEIVAITNFEKYKEFKSAIKPFNSSLKVLYGEEGLFDVAAYDKNDIIISSIVGIAGLKPTYKAVEKGKTVALANKETLVTAGRIITKKLRKKMLL